MQQKKGQPPNLTGKIGPLPYEKVQQLQEKYHQVKFEYIDGVAYMMAGGRLAHAKIIRATIEALAPKLSKDYLILSEVLTLLGKQVSKRENQFYPDVLVSCHPEDQEDHITAIQNPKLIVEVLSRSTAFKDRGVKLQAYMRHQSIQEIVLVEQEYYGVFVHRRVSPDSSLWEEQVAYGKGDTILLRSLGISVEVDALYALLKTPLDDENISLEDAEALLGESFI